MKKLFSALLILILWAGVASAASGWGDIKTNGVPASITSGEQTGNTIVTAAEGFITAIEIITDGTNNAKVICYDNDSAASGTVLLEMTVLGGNHFGGRNWSYPVHYADGIYCAGTGTGNSYIVEFLTR